VLLPDVNVLIYAHIEDSVPEHAQYANWITKKCSYRWGLSYGYRLTVA